MATAGLDDRGQPGRIELMSGVGIQIHRARFLVVNLRLVANVPGGVGVIFVQVQHADVGHGGQFRWGRGRIRFDFTLSKLLLMHVW